MEIGEIIACAGIKEKLQEGNGGNHPVVIFLQKRHDFLLLK
jgi:hypothetical protein